MARELALVTALFGEGATMCSYNGLTLVVDETMPPNVIAACETE